MGVLNSKSNNSLPTDEEVKRIKKLVGSQRFGQRLWNHYVKNHPEVKDHYSSFHQHVFYMSDGEFLDAVSEDVGE